MKINLNNKEDIEFLKSRIHRPSGRSLYDVVVQSFTEPKSERYFYQKNKQRARMQHRAIVEEQEQKHNKYRNTRIMRDGLKWDSIFEYQCWSILLDMQKNHVIHGLRRQVPVSFDVNGHKVGQFRADFFFMVIQDNGKIRHCYADAKSTFTAKLPRFKTQKKLMLSIYNQPIIEFIKSRTYVKETVYKLRDSMYDVLAQSN